ncbi:MAG: FkbM family methyltransferase [Pseudomonadota bacterium]
MTVAEHTLDQLGIAPEDMFSCEGAGGYKICPFPPMMKGDGTPYVDIVTKSIRLFGSWEAYETELIAEILTSAPDKRGLFVDVGAQLGYYTMLAATLGTRCVSFEANKDVYERLVAAAAVNGFDDRVNAQRAFVADQDAGVRKGAQVVTLDTVVGDRHVRVLKIDIEGLDPVAVAGAHRLFQDRRVDYAIIEISPKFADRTPVSDYIAMAQFIAQQGYTVYDIGICPNRALRADAAALAELWEIAPLDMTTAHLEAHLASLPQTNFAFERDDLKGRRDG